MRSLLVAVLVVAALGSACSGDDPADLPTGPTTPAAETYRTEPATTSLPARWWSWAAAQPAATNPVTDTTGAQCGRGQPSDLFFLAGTFGGGPVTRNCRVPGDRRLYFPVLTLYCPVSGGDEPSVVKGLATCRMYASRASATLDGVELPITAQSSNGAFTLTAAPGSPVQLPKPVLAVAWGLWVGPISVPDGGHVLHITGASPDRSVDVTYQLIVG